MIIQVPRDFQALGTSESGGGQGECHRDCRELGLSAQWLREKNQVPCWCLSIF